MDQIVGSYLYPDIIRMDFELTHKTDIPYMDIPKSKYN